MEANTYKNKPVHGAGKTLKPTWTIFIQNPTQNKQLQWWQRILTGSSRDNTFNASSEGYTTTFRSFIDLAMSLNLSLAIGLFEILFSNTYILSRSFSNSGLRNLFACKAYGHEILIVIYFKRNPQHIPNQNTNEISQPIKILYLFNYSLRAATLQVTIMFFKKLPRIMQEAFAKQIELFCSHIWSHNNHGISEVDATSLPIN